MGTQRPNGSKYVRMVSKVFFFALEARLVNLELTYKLFVSSGVLAQVAQAWISMTIVIVA